MTAYSHVLEHNIMRVGMLVIGSCSLVSGQEAESGKETGDLT
jgi:hypothetical protein